MEIEDPENPGPYIVDGTEGDEDRFEPGIDDLTEPLRQRLGDYLSDNTLNGHTNGYQPTRGNTYTIPPGSTETSYTEAGKPLPIITAGGRLNPDQAFSPMGTTLDLDFGASELFDGGTGVGGQTLGDFLSRGGVDPDAAHSGHTLLPDATISTGLRRHGQAEAPSLAEDVVAPVNRLVSQALQKNRWNPRASETPFDPEGNRADDGQSELTGIMSSVADTMPIAGVQKELGSYDPNAPSINFDQLRRVALSLMLQATGESGAGTVDPLSSDMADKGQVPGATQLGIPRTQAQLRASDAFGAPRHDGGADPLAERPSVHAGSKAGVTDMYGRTPFSYGSFNSYLEKFGGNDTATNALAATIILSLGAAMKPLEMIMVALLEPVTALEALARIMPIGSMKVTGRGPLAVPPIINLNDLTARMDSQGKPPLIFGGRSSRRSLMLTPIVAELLGVVVPDNQSGLSGAGRSGIDVPPDPTGTKYTMYIRTVEWGIVTMFFPTTVLQSPGFYITVAREIIRSTLDLARSTELLNGQVVSEAAGASMNATLHEMLTSKLANFINVMTTIGNAALKHNPMLLQLPISIGFNPGSPILPPSGITSVPGFPPLSYQNQLPANYALASKSGKLGGAGRGAGYRAGNALTMLLQPESFSNASTNSGLAGPALISTAQRIEAELVQAKETYGPLGLATAALSSLTGLQIKSPGGAYDQLVSRETPYGVGDSRFRRKSKIEVEDREAIEDELEAEYMPFYFHDLRTNEIVSFQAFLESLTDSYSVQHTSTDAYGRIDSIKIYKSTSRTLSLSFTIAATNHLDFDIMYTKINKLVTLIYPQWSPGRVLQDPSDNKIIQPFSQIPTASPVIRLRIGDIVRTNYSKFNLLRLFGMGTDNFAITSNAVQEAAIKAIRDAIMAAGTDPNTGEPLPGIEELANQAAAALAGSTTSDITDEAKNPVLRSFRAVGGRGLAGVITSLNFDWLGGNTWEVAKYGSRAPKLCKVSVAFAPMHDIAPGIDADGMNRAPLYPVGDAMRSVAGLLEDKLGREKFMEIKKQVDEVINQMVDKTGIVDYT